MKNKILMSLCIATLLFSTLVVVIQAEPTNGATMANVRKCENYCMNTYGHLGETAFYACRDGCIHGLHY